jgi:hypothetical protein
MTHTQRYASISFVLLLLLFGLSCDKDEDNFLDGSLVKNFHISYDSIQVQLTSDSLSVKYLSDEEVPSLQVSIDRNQAKIKAGGIYPLEEYGSVTRYIDYGELPELQSGELVLEEFKEKDGATISGTFHAVLSNPGESKQTLRGAFKTKLMLVTEF